MTATIDKPRLESLYADDVKAKILKEFNLGNVSLAPKLVKITVNVGIGRFLDNQKIKPEIKDTVIATLTQITGQKPIMLLAKKSVDFAFCAPLDLARFYFACLLLILSFFVF